MFFPLIAHAFSTTDLVKNISFFIIRPIIGILLAFALVLFLWGVVQFLINADNEKGREEGKRRIIWSLIGVFIMVSALGIMSVAKNILG